MELSDAARKQGDLWGRSARDWAAIQEKTAEPVWTAALDAARVGPGTRLLDAGCGSGGACLLAAARRADVFGIDPSANLITVARERLPLADFRIGEIENLPFSNGKFDAVVAVNSLQYVENAHLAMHELGRVCRSGGRVVGVVFADPESCDAVHIYRAVVALFDKPPSSSGPFALSARRDLRELAESVAELRFDSIEEVDCPMVYDDLDTATRGQMSAGGTWRAVEICGEDRVRSAIRGTLERFRQPDGSIHMRNRLRYVVAVKV